MIVVQSSDPYLRKAAVRAAHWEEDVITDAKRGREALEWGWPRLVIGDDMPQGLVSLRGVPHLNVTRELRRRWEADRRAHELPPTRLDALAERLSAEIARHTRERSWVDQALADLSRASGARIPGPLRAFGRRIMEFPGHYTTLKPLAATCGTSRGALKARFRRRGLESPSAYLRWFRLLAVAHVLQDPSVSVASSARRLGFTSDGNLCRMMWNVASLTPTEVRSQQGRNRLRLTFAWRLLSSEALEGWATMDDLFDRRVA